MQLICGSMECMILIANNDKIFDVYSVPVSGPLEFVEPDLSSLPPQRPMSPDAVNENKRDSISEKSKAGKLDQG